jgi:hypothetical protein
MARKNQTEPTIPLNRRCISISLNFDQSKKQAKPRPSNVKRWINFWLRIKLKAIC